MSSIQPRGISCADEELRTIGVGSSIGHREGSLSSVLQLKVFVFKFGAIDGLASCAIVVGKILKEIFVAPIMR